MELTTFHELTQEITSECFFMTPSQQEEKVIQLIDLHHFIECSPMKLEVVSYLRHPINIVKQDDLTIGILFYDMKRSSLPDCNDSEAFRRRHNLSALWFVFVEEEFCLETATHTDLIIENSLDIFYEKIFLFNFFQSIIHPLK
ncbi:MULTISPECIES: hypothetical protein [Chryseobacterium]|jgi:hypothetical protein|uniref:Rpn family recombination-promoting nuclease/putative transposase n=2 Tax=Chryseobacterium TaxID=59732 RepID=A0ABX9II28_9FLAO|nr:MULTISPECIES: hypothetical protein [Chryseobacterium]MDC8099660.1 hypothetical protein [Chryseobacterium rhizosphaerae]MDR6547415.1 hypothetical protein [Chryseobacterium rhizosphaerae]REC73977.1 hypothetical protein DRF57_15500 [Chryseobacterium rhizosphaerae]SMC99773.1 hypothetical protein SAMN02787074_4356 [Chryseobacterium sp. YR221]GEN67356.1 hypothetical protein CRH01_19240 [Chryseobacterium rhizosphaerae]